MTDNQNSDAGQVPSASVDDEHSVIEIPELPDDHSTRPTIGVVTKTLVALTLILGLSTAVIAQTAPQLLAPIANSIPDSFFPQPEINTKSFSGSGSC